MLLYSNNRINKYNNSNSNNKSSNNNKKFKINNSNKCRINNLFMILFKVVKGYVKLLNVMEWY